MACGLPAVAPRSLGPALIVEDGRTGRLTAPGDEEALAAAMVELVEDPAKRARLGEEARAAAHARFSWEGISDELGTVLREVIAMPSGTLAPPRQQRPDVGHGA